MRTTFSWVVLMALAGCGGGTVSTPSGVSDAAPDDGGPGAPDAADGTDAASSDAASSDAASSDAASSDAAPTSADAAPSTDAGPLPRPGACPTSPPGVIDWTHGCWTFTPDDAASALGAPTYAAGVNHDQDQYALGPDPSTDRHQLLLWVNGTNATARAAIADPTRNFYRAAASLGYHVLAIAYRNDATIESADCHLVDSCFFPSRRTVIEGVVQPGAASALSDMLLTESIDARAVLALRYLAAADPTGGWAQFLVPGVASTAPAQDQIRWASIAAAGHSQGAGHAVAIGRLYAVSRVAALSGPCEYVSTDGVTVMAASWLHATPDWRTDPTSVYFGLAAPSSYSVDPVTGVATTMGDLCYPAPINWTALGIPAARQNANAATCGVPPTNTMLSHAASFRCPDNEPNWEAMLR